MQHDKKRVSSKGFFYYGAKNAKFIAFQKKFRYFLYMKNEWKNLAPKLVRQRVVIEATNDHVVTEPEIADYLRQLSDVLNMRPLQEPYTYPAEDMGYGGWIHWVTSGAHFYSYTTEKPFFSVDAYTCKPFDAARAVEFTRGYFDADEIVYKEIDV